jgi:chromate transport protein ChrA
MFLKIGGMSYGVGIIGIMQSEVQEKRQWIGKEEFVEGLALVNMLPGPPGAQLSIFLGHAKGSLIGGILAGVFYLRFSSCSPYRQPMLLLALFRPCAAPSMASVLSS